MTTVGVAIPTIPPRYDLLARAVRSVLAQKRPANEIAVVADIDHDGATATRNRAWRMLQTDWVAFLDDDDTLYPEHIQALLMHAETTGADLLYPWFDVDGGTDPLACPVNGELVSPFGVDFGGEQAAYIRDVGNFVPVTTLVRRSLLEGVGGFPQPCTSEWPHPTAEDWGFLIKAIRAGAKIAHLGQRTWTWHHHGANTSGSPANW